MHKYLADRKIPFNRCGKLIVATSEEEIPGLESLYEKAQKNGVDSIRKISRADAKFIEPQIHCRSALWSPLTSIFDTHSYMTSLVAESEERGVNFVYNCDVLSVQCLFDVPRFIVRTTQGDLMADVFINACGHNASAIYYQVPNGFPNINDRTPVPYFLKGNYFKYSRKSSPRFAQVTICRRQTISTSCIPITS